MLDALDLDAVVIATPSRTHGSLVRSALERGLHVFCEKPFTLSAREAAALAELGRERDAVTQVGYHNRFVGAFREVKALIDAGAIGRVTHALGEAYGPVILRSEGRTWRTRGTEGGGALYEYASHPIDLVTWYLGPPVGVGGTVLGHVFSDETVDEVFSTLFFSEGQTAQISVNWSDESYRKMTTRITVWGTAGRIYADRQECQVYLRATAPAVPGYERGWNVRYATELTPPVWFYLRGEEYSAQIDYFVRRVASGAISGINDFASAAATDEVLSMMVTDAAKGPSTEAGDTRDPNPVARPGGRRRPFSRR
jgi:predicted dehydrogenase